MAEEPIIMKPLDPIRFKFNEGKAAAAAALLLRLGGGRMPYMRLIKMLYLADRESLVRFGRPITGDRYYLMKLGPVLSSVFDLIKETAAGSPTKTEPGPWATYIERDSRYTVRLKADPDLAPLSEAEVELLTEAVKLCETLDHWHLSQLTHALPEWRDPGDSSIELAPEEILRAVGKTDEDIEETRQEALERSFFDRVFRT